MKRIYRITCIFIYTLCQSTIAVGQPDEAIDYHAMEKEALVLINKVRQEPKKFLSDTLWPYLRENGDSTDNPYVASLIKDLEKQKPVRSLTWAPYLHDRAHEFAKDMGEKGLTGHYSKKLGSLEQRLKKFSEYYPIGENCDYGSETALDIVMSLLIDDGVPGVGHRKNILDPSFQMIGIAIEPHKTYDVNCVMDFTGPTPKKKK